MVSLTLRSGQFRLQIHSSDKMLGECVGARKGREMWPALIVSGREVQGVDGRGRGTTYILFTDGLN